MSGPECYREAGRLLTADPQCACERSDCEHEAAMLARAQVFATLALAAATGAPFGNEGKWDEVTR